MSFDQQQVASLIRKFASADKLLAEAYVNGSVFADEGIQNVIEGLKKTGILRVADRSCVYC